MTNAILTCSPQFTEFALNELTRQHSALTVIQHLSPQHILLTKSGTFDHLTRPWRHKLPIYLHHLFPVHVEVCLTGECTDLDILREAVQHLVKTPITVQARIAENIDVLYDACTIHQYLNPAQAPENMPEPDGRILSILVANVDGNLRGYLGVSWATQNLSCWSGGVIPLTEEVPNRAGLKLIEALHTFEIRLWKNSYALDLGAAPGAWTTIMRRRDVCITGVAPTRLYPYLQQDSGVQFFQMTAEEYLYQCDETYDMLLNDMKMDVQDSALLMIEYARHLKSGGIAIMTLKLRQRNRRQVMDHAFRILRRAYKIIRVRQLVSNRSEVTLFLRRKK